MKSSVWSSISKLDKAVLSNLSSVLSDEISDISKTTSGNVSINRSMSGASEDLSQAFSALSNPTALNSQASPVPAPIIPTAPEDWSVKDMLKKVPSFERIDSSIKGRFWESCFSC